MQSWIRRWICIFVTGPVLVFGQTPADALAEAQRMLKEYDLNGAYEVVQKAAAQKPESAELFSALGDIDYLRGEFSAAEMEFKKALRLDDRFAPSWVGLGRVFEAASLREKAKACYRKAYQAHPGNPETQRYYARTLTGTEQLLAQEAYLAKAAGKDDPEMVDQIRRQIELSKWAGDRTLFKLSSPLEHAEIKLSHLMFDSQHIRGFALPVSFNGGRPLRLLVDSGAGGIVLNKKAAESAGLPRIADIQFRGIGDEGDRTGYTAVAESVKIGDVSFKNCPITVSERKFLTDEDGLIGTNIFAMFLVTIDFQKMILKLDPLPPHKATPADANWQDREVAPEFSNYTPFWRAGHAILLSTRVNGSKPALFLIDTGASDSLIDPTYARQFTGIRSEDLVRMEGVSGKVKKVESAGRLTFEFGHYRQPVPGMLAIPLARVSRDSPQMTGIFGITALANFRLQINYRDGLINLDYIGPKY
jgi:predicted aspartyl protease